MRIPTTFALAVLAPLILTACDPSAPQSRQFLPLPPNTFGQQVALPPARLGESVHAYAVRVLGGLIRANERLKNDRLFYLDVRKQFSR